MSHEFLTVVGLGNPGGRYATTRHNIGFAVVDVLRACSGVTNIDDVEAQACSLAGDALAGNLTHDGWQDRGSYYESTTSISGWNAQLIKPMTFMNRSGEPLQQALSFRKISVDQVVVIHDEIDLPLGTVRVKVDGGEGGHNGLRSISELCGGRGYARVRVGVGKPPTESPLASREDGVAAWVLSKFTSEELPIVERLVAKAALAVALIGLKGIRVAQNRLHP